MEHEIKIKRTFFGSYVVYYSGECIGKVIRSRLATHGWNFTYYSTHTWASGTVLSLSEVHEALGDIIQSYEERYLHGDKTNDQ